MRRALGRRAAAAQKQTNVTSQPRAQHLASPLHGLSPEQLHEPLVQALVFEPHLLPQLPQLLVSLLRLLQLLLQQVWPLPH